MNSLTRAMLPAVALFATISVASAQPTQPDHQAHHPAAQSQSQSQPQAGGAPDAMGSGGMPMMGMMDSQGGMMMDMGAMHSMMQRMMGSAGDMGAMRGMGMMPFAHVEGRLAFLRTELGITDAQKPEWDAFAEALRSAAQTMQAAHEGMAHGAPVMAWPDRLARQVRVLSARLEAARAIEAAAGPLYSSLNEEQKRMANELMAGPMGMM